jgi:signal transduction histidine kinase
LPLRKVRREIARLRAGKAKLIEGAMPADVAPMVEELNALVTHNDRQAEEARRHAGNLAHALKTPLTVIMNAAAAGSSDLDSTVIREARTMRRQIDHHLARARAVGRRGSAHSRAPVWPSIQAVERAVARLYPNVRIDVDGDKTPVAHIEKQDLDEIVGNLVENAAKYGGGSVFITSKVQSGFVEILVEDDGVGIPEADRIRIFDRGVRLDSGKPGTGLGLAIVRDVAEIYDGTVSLEESEDLGGLLVRLRLPAAS